jgi:hypothetical protein
VERIKARHISSSAGVDDPVHSLYKRSTLAAVDALHPFGFLAEAACAESSDRVLEPRKISDLRTYRGTPIEIIATHISIIDVEGGVTL